MPPEHARLCDDMLRSGRRIIRRTAGLTIERFLADEDAVDVSLRHFTIIGEAMHALKKLSPTAAAAFRRPTAASVFGTN